MGRLQPWRLGNSMCRLFLEDHLKYHGQMGYRGLPERMEHIQDDLALKNICNMLQHDGLADPCPGRSEHLPFPRRGTGPLATGIPKTSCTRMVEAGFEVATTRSIALPPRLVAEREDFETQDHQPFN